MRLRSITFTACLGLLCFTGCAGAATPATQSVAPTTQTSTVLSIQDAVASAQLEQDNWELDLPSELPFKNRHLFFGQLSIYENDKPTATVPVIAFKRGEQTLALKIEDPRLKNAGWSYCASGPGKDELWGVLDASLDDRQADLLMVHSTDAGDTLSITAIPKPHPAAVFDSFCMDRQGHGRVSMYVYRDQGKLKNAGYYNYRTTDGGKTWSPPQHEPDAMSPADDAPDEPEKAPMHPSRV